MLIFPHHSPPLLQQPPVTCLISSNIPNAQQLTPDLSHQLMADEKTSPAQLPTITDSPAPTPLTPPTTAPLLPCHNHQYFCNAELWQQMETLACSQRASDCNPSYAKDQITLIRVRCAPAAPTAPLVLLSLPPLLLLLLQLSLPHTCPRTPACSCC
jgi:hypothetical protein